MFIDIVRDIEMSGMEKTIMMSMAEAYEDNMPDVMYLNQYELTESFGFTIGQWKKFLKIKEVNRAIEMEMASVMEVSARQALKQMQSGKSTSADITAAKALLENSKLLKQKLDQPTIVVVTRIPAKREVEK